MKILCIEIYYGTFLIELKWVLFIVRLQGISQNNFDKHYGLCAIIVKVHFRFIDVTLLKKIMKIICVIQTDAMQHVF